MRHGTWKCSFHGTDIDLDISLFFFRMASRFHVCLQDIVSAEDNRALSIEFEPLRIPPEDVTHLSQVAMLTLDARKSRAGVDPEQGHIIVIGRQGERLNIPYTMDMMRG